MKRAPDGTEWRYPYVRNVFIESSLKERFRMAAYKNHSNMSAEIRAMLTELKRKPITVAAPVYRPTFNDKVQFRVDDHFLSLYNSLQHPPQQIRRKIEQYIKRTEKIRKSA